MKKLLSCLLAVCLICCCFAFSGCSEGKKEIYSLSRIKITEDGSTFTVDAGETYENRTYYEDTCVIFYKDKVVAKLHSSYYDEYDEENEEYTEVYALDLYEGEGDEIYLVMLYEGIVGTLDGNTLTLKMDDETYIFEK